MLTVSGHFNILNITTNIIDKIDFVIIYVCVCVCIYIYIYCTISIMYKHFVVHMGEFLESIGDKIPSFVGIKFTSTNFEEAAQALRADNGKYTIFVGNEVIK